MNVANAEVFKILRSNIYSDAILACIRETVFNSIDAHAYNSNENKPIRVKLPNAIDPSISTNLIMAPVYQKMMLEIFFVVMDLQPRILVINISD